MNFQNPLSWILKYLAFVQSSRGAGVSLFSLPNPVPPPPPESLLAGYEVFAAVVFAVIVLS